MAAGKVGIDQSKSRRPNERTSRQEVVRPPADQGPQDVDVAIEGSGMLLGIAPCDGGLADTWRAVEEQQARHVGDYTQG